MRTDNAKYNIREIIIVGVIIKPMRNVLIIIIMATIVHITDNDNENIDDDNDNETIDDYSDDENIDDDSDEGADEERFVLMMLMRMRIMMLMRGLH